MKKPSTIISNKLLKPLLTTIKMLLDCMNKTLTATSQNISTLIEMLTNIALTKCPQYPLNEIVKYHKCSSHW